MQPKLLSKLRSGPYLLEMSEAEKSYTARKPYNVVDGIAIISVCGVLINDESWWDGWGCSSYARIASEIRGALEAVEVEGILLLVDSPGGETDNAFETAALIREASEIKPIWAVANVSAYSAAYLLASSASTIFAPETSGGLGSIGVYMLHLDYSKALEDFGIKVTIIKAGEGKAAGNPYEALGDDAAEKFKAEVDRLYDAFVGHVSYCRGVNAERIKDQIGAHTYHGGVQLIDMNLADEVGSFEDAIQRFRAELSAAKGQGASFAAASAAKQTKGADTSMSTKLLNQSRAGASAGDNPKPKGATDDEEEEKEKKTSKSEKYEDDEEEEEEKEDSKAKVSDFQRGYAAAREVVAICKVANRADLAFGFLQKNASAEAVTKSLLNASATEQEEQAIVSHNNSGTSASDAAGLAGKKSAAKDGKGLLAAVEKLGKG